MNLLQHVRQAKNKLDAAVWPSGTQGRLFPPDSVAICTPEQIPLAVRELSTPFALIIPGTSTADDEEPFLERSTFDVIVVQHEEGGGELDFAALVGGIRGGGVGESEGRGVLEIIARVKAELGQLTGADGAPAIARYSGAPAAAKASGTEQYACAQRISVDIRSTAAPSYEPPHRLSLSDAGAHAIAASWVLPPARYDRRRVVVVWKAGATAPTSITDGTEVSVAATATSVTFAPTGAAGTFSVAVFETYDETGGGTDEVTAPQKADAYGTVAVA